MSQIFKPMSYILIKRYSLFYYLYFKRCHNFQLRQKLTDANASPFIFEEQLKNIDDNSLINRIYTLFRVFNYFPTIPSYKLALSLCYSSIGFRYKYKQGPDKNNSFVWLTGTLSGYFFLIFSPSDRRFSKGCSSLYINFIVKGWEMLKISKKICRRQCLQTSLGFFDNCVGGRRDIH